MSMLRECPRCKEQRNRANFVSGICRQCNGAATGGTRVYRKPRICNSCDLDLPPSAFKSHKARHCMACVEINREAKKHRPYVPANQMEGFNAVMQRFLSGGYCGN